MAQSSLILEFLLCCRHANVRKDSRWIDDLGLYGAGPDELQGYLEALMAKLLEVVRTGNSDTQETALGAIASAANAAGSSFQPYVAAVFPVLRQYMEARFPVLCLLVLVVIIASCNEIVFHLSSMFLNCATFQKLQSQLLSLVSCLASMSACHSADGGLMLKPGLHPDPRSSKRHTSAVV